MTFPTISLPRMIKVHQDIVTLKIDDYISKIKDELKRSNIVISNAL